MINSWKKFSSVNLFSCAIENNFLLEKFGAAELSWAWNDSGKNCLLGPDEMLGPGELTEDIWFGNRTRKKSQTNSDDLCLPLYSCYLFYIRFHANHNSVLFYTFLKLWKIAYIIFCSVVWYYVVYVPVMYKYKNCSCLRNSASPLIIIAVNSWS